MIQIILPEPGGSYFCETCCLEYDGTGKCGCGGEIKFVSMHSNRYLSIWMASRGTLEKARKEKTIVG